MTGFEALFAFYALLLGLAVANVTSAFADMFRSRTDVRIGWTVPLLGALVLLSAGLQWLSLFGAQELRLEAATLFTCLAMALPYIFVSQAMTPGPGRAVSLEQHYAGHRRVLLIVLAVPLITSFIFNGLEVASRGTWTGEDLLNLFGYNGVRLVVLAVMLAWPATWVQRTGLLALCAYTILLMV